MIKHVFRVLYNSFLQKAVHQQQPNECVCDLELPASYTKSKWDEIKNVEDVAQSPKIRAVHTNERPATQYSSQKENGKHKGETRPPPGQDKNDPLQTQTDGHGLDDKVLIGIATNAPKKQEESVQNNHAPMGTSEFLQKQKQ